MLLTKVKNYLLKQLLKNNNYKTYSDIVKIVEVGPRDGLQNEKTIIPTSQKIELINRLSKTGLKYIEITSFVSAKWIPQMSDNSQVFKEIEKVPGIDYSVLVPNLKGLSGALEAGVKTIAIFIAASETFSQKNTNCSINESIKRCSELINQAKPYNINVRGYISCIVGCPYEGQIKSKVVTDLAASLLDLGCYEVSLADTIGVGTPTKIKQILNDLKSLSFKNLDKFAIHCHDTYGQALVNVYASLDEGIRTFDSSVAGLGGCPYASGATGNLATEDLLYLLHGQGFETGIDLNPLMEVGHFISNALGRRNESKVGVALSKKKIT